MIGVLAGVAVLIAAAGSLALGGGRDARDRSSTSVPEHATPRPSFLRTVLVSRVMPLPSAHARRLSAMLEDGSMPDGPMTADVMSDTDCVPDAEMISRCRNVMRLADGRTLVLRHPHDMRHVPCLAPGERVQLIPTGV